YCSCQARRWCVNCKIVACLAAASCAGPAVGMIMNGLVSCRSIAAGSLLSDECASVSGWCVCDGHEVLGKAANTAVGHCVKFPHPLPAVSGAVHVPLHDIQRSLAARR